MRKNSFRVPSTIMAGVLLVAVIWGCGQDGPSSPLEESGSIVVDSNPDSLGAPWNLQGPDGFARSGTGDAQLQGVKTGSYSMEWGPVSGWTTPADETANLVADKELTFFGLYTEIPTEQGTIVVNPSPDGIAAPWGLEGPFSNVLGSGNKTLTEMAVGTYTMTWESVPGYITPDNHTLILADQDTITFKGVYQEFPTGHISVQPSGTPSPASWILSGPTGDIEGSGSQELASLPIGEYFLDWGPVLNYATPGPVTLALAEDETITFTGEYEPSISMAGDMVWVPPEEDTIPATFTMGSDYDDFETPHNVTLTHRIRMTETEVTYGEFLQALNWAYSKGHVRVEGTIVYSNHDGSVKELLDFGLSGLQVSFSGGVFTTTRDLNKPMLTPRWYGAAAYCDWLNLQAGLPRTYDHSWWNVHSEKYYAATGYRLPTEAEWEFACRAGTTTNYNTGDCIDPSTEAVFYGPLPLDGCPAGPSGTDTVPVRSFPPNHWGLYEMHGNIEEWVFDWTAAYSGEDETDPSGPYTGTLLKSARGGMYMKRGELIRSASRYGGGPDGMINGGDRGLRIVRP